MPMPISEFLWTHSYKEFSVPTGSHAEKFYQKKIVTDADSGARVKRFINVSQWDLHKLYPQVPEGKTFEVEETFETTLDGCWWKGMYYGLSEAQLTTLLPLIEARLQAIFTSAGGVSND